MAKPYALQDPKKRKTLLDAFALGATIKMACEAARVSVAAFHFLKAEVESGKQRNGKRLEPWKVELVEEIRERCAAGDMNALAAIRNGMKKNWQAGAWLLERRHPQEYGRPWRQPDVPEGPDMSPDAVAAKICAAVSEIRAKSRPLPDLTADPDVRASEKVIRKRVRKLSAAKKP